MDSAFSLVAGVQETYVAGVSTSKVDQVVESLGLRVSKSEVSRVCEGLDEQVEAFRSGPLEGRYPCGLPPHASSPRCSSATARIMT